MQMDGKDMPATQILNVATRPRFLLSLVATLGGQAGNLDFQKVLFLYCQEPESSGLYEFVPYLRGAFSFTSYADRRKLIARGLLGDDENRWELTDLGRETAEPTLRTKQFVANLDGLRGDALIAQTYRQFPYYAIRSLIAERVLAGDREALARIETEKERVRTGQYRLQTIGYEGRSLENYLNSLIQSGVTLLCDVRRNPISRKYGFSKKTLENACTGVGLKYKHLQELGIASEYRRELNTQADYDALFEIYERDHLPRQGAGLAQIQSWMNSGERVALTCYERLPHQCHRHCVAERLMVESCGPVEIHHL